MSNSNNEENAKYQCIFCYKTDLEVPFSKEHIIPDAVLGNLILHNSVCKECNDWFGANLDHKILNLPEIANAFKLLGFDARNEEMLKNKFNITGRLNSGLELRGKVVDGNTVFTQQVISDGSRIIPEYEAEKSILKTLSRNKKIKEIKGYSEKEIKNKFGEFWKEYERATFDEIVKSEDFPFTVIKRFGEVVDVKAKPKKEIHTEDLLPLFAKISYEILYFVIGGKLFNKSHDDLRKKLIRIINEDYENYKINTDQNIRAVSANGCMLVRETPGFDTFQQFHTIRIDFLRNICVFHVSFFGKVKYMFVVNTKIDEIKNSIMSDFKLPDLELLIFRLNFQEVKVEFSFKTSKGVTSNQFQT